MYIYIYLFVHVIFVEKKDTGGNIMFGLGCLID